MISRSSSCFRLPITGVLRRPLFIGVESDQGIYNVGRRRGRRHWIREGFYKSVIAPGELEGTASLVSNLLGQREHERLR